KAGQSLGAIAKVVPWNAKTLDGWEETLDGASAVVNLAGENIASGRWTKSKKNRILRSRLDASEAIVKAIRQTEHKPNLVIQASAVGYYGTRGDEILYEDSPRLPRGRL
ncbi:MAG: NAD-dependent epimerase/dehydratase family protein, partial [Planctomycetota bacterium]